MARHICHIYTYKCATLCEYYANRIFVIYCILFWFENVLSEYGLSRMELSCICRQVSILVSRHPACHWLVTSVEIILLIKIGGMCG